MIDNTTYIVTQSHIYSKKYVDQRQKEEIIQSKLEHGFYLMTWFLW